MGLINFEANEENPQNYSNFSDDEKICSEGNFINDSAEITNEVSFYRSSDNNSVEH